MTASDTFLEVIPKFCRLERLLHPAFTSCLIDIGNGFNEYTFGDYIGIVPIAKGEMGCVLIKDVK